MQLYKFLQEENSMKDRMLCILQMGEVLNMIEVLQR
jgi:hypothetical protein